MNDLKKTTKKVGASSFSTFKSRNNNSENKSTVTVTVSVPLQRTIGFGLPDEEVLNNKPASPPLAVTFFATSQYQQPAHASFKASTGAGYPAQVKTTAKVVKEETPKSDNEFDEQLNIFNAEYSDNESDNNLDDEFNDEFNDEFDGELGDRLKKTKSLPIETQTSDEFAPGSYPGELESFGQLFATAPRDMAPRLGSKPPITTSRSRNSFNY